MTSEIHPGFETRGISRPTKGTNALRKLKKKSLKPIDFQVIIIYKQI